MAAKEPVLLTVMIETTQMRWFVAGISLTGESIPLMRSALGNLNTYVGSPFDEQVSFLRHRLAGVLQRGCDRLWGREKKPCQVVFVADDLFQQAEEELTQRVAEHFVTWMANPPVVFFLSENGLPLDRSPKLRRLAGELPLAYESALDTGLRQLSCAREQDDTWEEAPEKKPPAN